MTERGEAILKKALELTDQERAELAGALLESLEPPADSSIEAAWRAEVARRVAELEAGAVETVPWVEVRDRLYARLSGGTR